MQPEVLKTHTRSVNINRNGYLYVYLSNQSNLDVFFDNLQVVHSRGPLLEETHYYPFGLTMAGISSKAAGKLENRFKYNGNKLESGEWSDGTGLEMYDFNARTYDQQVGRFMQTDPLSEEEGQEVLSPYHYTGNNPIRFNDPTGKCGWCKEVWKDVKSAAKETWAATKRGVNIAYNKASNFARGFNQMNPIANAVELISGKSSASDFTESKPRAQAFADMGVNTVMMLTGEAVGNGMRGEAALLKGSTAEGMQIARTNLAAEFYEQSGFSTEKAASHMQGIDFSKPVQTMTLKEGTVIQQWVGESGVGNYFTTIENGAAKNLGISYEGRTLKSFTLTADVKVLKSTAGEYGGNAGGGVQYFSTELQKAIKPVK